MQKFLNKIICGDCIEILGQAREPFADLIFAGPPFNIGYEYDKYYDKVKSKNWTKRLRRITTIRYAMPSTRPAIRSASTRTLRLILCVTGLLRICWKTASTSVSYKCCSATPASARPRSTLT